MVIHATGNPCQGPGSMTEHEMGQKGRHLDELLEISN
jgi:hypothetical protein